MGREGEVTGEVDVLRYCWRVPVRAARASLRGWAGEGGCFWCRPGCCHSRRRRGPLVEGVVGVAARTSHKSVLALLGNRRAVSTVDPQRKGRESRL